MFGSLLEEFDSSLLEEFDSVLSEGRKPEKLRTDKGTDILNESS